MPVGGSAFQGGVGGPDEIEKVTVDYTWEILTPVLRPFFTNGQVHFRVSSMMKNEKFDNAMRTTHLPFASCVRTAARA